MTTNLTIDPNYLNTVKNVLGEYSDVPPTAPKLEGTYDWSIGSDRQRDPATCLFHKHITKEGDTLIQNRKTGESFLIKKVSTKEADLILNNGTTSTNFFKKQWKNFYGK